MDRVKANLALGEFGARIGMPGLCLDASGACRLVFEQRWSVTLMLHPVLERLVLYCPLEGADRSEALGAPTLREMLQANFMGQAVMGGSLAIGPDGRPCLQFELPLPTLDGHGVQVALERLLAAADDWSRRLAEGQARHPAAQSLPHAFLPGRI